MNVLDIIFVAIGVLCVVFSFVGCVIPAIPGPLLAYVSLLLLLLTSHPIGLLGLAVGGVIMIVATLLDYVVPAMGARKFKCSASGVTGCLIGSILGMFFMPIGLFLGPFLGAVIGELISGRKILGSVQGGFGALLGFVAGTMIKILACAVLATMFTFSACRGVVEGESGGSGGVGIATP